MTLPCLIIGSSFGRRTSQRPHIHSLPTCQVYLEFLLIFNTMNSSFVFPPPHSWMVLGSIQRKDPIFWKMFLLYLSWDFGEKESEGLWGQCHFESKVKTTHFDLVFKQTNFRIVNFHLWDSCIRMVWDFCHNNNNKNKRSTKAIDRFCSALEYWGLVGYLQKW